MKNRNSVRPLTVAQRSALLWLRNRGGEGVFNNHGVLLAQGELAPVMRSTWNALHGHKLIKPGRMRRRITVTQAGLDEDLTHVTESKPAGGTLL